MSAGTCDFCSAPTGQEGKRYWPKWRIELSVPEPARYVDEGDWAACAVCAALIDAADWKGLMDRAKQFNPGIRKAAEKGLVNEVAGFVAETWGGVFGLPPGAFL